MLKAYYRLTKPGIIYGNALTAAAGFYLASGRHVAAGRLVAALVGISLVVACGCVLNNWLDRGIDQRMARTQRRALVTGAISVRGALTFAAVLGVLGFIVLGVFTNLLTVLLGVIGLICYVIVYGIAKRRSVFGTIVGSVSGALPPVAGYTAASGQLDASALLLFAILTLWQMPHFYAIAIYRLKDYQAANLPVWPARRGIASTKRQILLFAVAFAAVAPLLALMGKAGVAYLAIMSALGVAWAVKGAKGFRQADDVRWARGMFGFSLLVISAFSLALIGEAVYTWNMLLVFHITVALSSLGFTTYLFFAPSPAKLRVSYTLAGLTLASGTYLVWSKPAHIMQSCITGITYLAIVSAGILAARAKLAALETAKSEN